ncbi:Vacuolar membrane protein [Drechslerella dactyloides]|uniref:superoxide dismutase n=1 Tax=Drechslerella dactyloides TaxID=74499 RepID=A0AAD6NJ25_DREDA|nr:Vacuolar membrane protein [Drechslerella dactyloides]
MIRPVEDPDPELSEHHSLLSGDRKTSPIDYSAVSKSPQPIISINRQPDEEASAEDSAVIQETPPGFWGVVACLLIGVIVANVDTSLVMATFGQIGSEFGRLDDANWMIVGYQLGILSTQSMYGKLSDIFGRKALLLFAYSLFATGCLWMTQWNINRVLASYYWQSYIGYRRRWYDFCGINSPEWCNADLVPLRDLAAWRSYVYIAATAGRACGAPLGGFMVDTIGWRWSFLGQVPLALLAIVMVSWKLQIPSECKEDSLTLRQRFQRIDFLGAMTLAASLSLLLVSLDEAGKRLSTRNPLLIGASVGSIVLAAIFFYIEAKVAKEPILSLEVLTNRDVVSVYSILGLTTGSQIALVTTISIYFVITLGVSNANAAARIVFGNVAHAAGGLLAGILIKRTGRYKRYLLFAISVSTVALLLITLRWRGHTNIFETAYIFPAGFGIGMINTAAFIALSASIKSEDQAMATSGFYLCDNLGFVAIGSLGNAVLQLALDERLHAKLAKIPSAEREQIIHQVMTSIWNIKLLPEKVRGKAVEAFVEALQWDHVSCYGQSLEDLPQMADNSTVRESPQGTVYVLPPLPYPYDALEPHISTQIMELHHRKHHQAYVNNLNGALEELGKLRNSADMTQIRTGAEPSNWKRS